MADFVQRTSAPSEDNALYYKDNPFYKAGYGLPNCTCYAWGRFYELSGERPALSLGNAENWYGYADGYARGKTPKLGAVACWRKGEAGVADDGAGHVAIVEAINGDGSITTSNSGWGGSLFWTEVNQQDGNGYSCGSAYTFQGFIYNPVDFEGTGLPDMTPISANRYLTRSEMETNARYIWNYLGSRGWSINAVAGMLGNMQTESTINPGIWQNLTEDDANGYGLVQWTPSTKYTSWCKENGLTPSAMDSALQRIIYELENGVQYYATDAYPLSFAEYAVSTKDPYYLGMAFLANYERPATINQTKRGTQAEEWYKYLCELPAPSATKGSRKGMKLMLMYLATRRRF